MLFHVVNSAKDEIVGCKTNGTVGKIHAPRSVYANFWSRNEACNVVTALVGIGPGGKIATAPRRPLERSASSGEIVILYRTGLRGFKWKRGGSTALTRDSTLFINCVG